MAVFEQCAPSTSVIVSTISKMMVDRLLRPLYNVIHTNVELLEAAFVDAQADIAATVKRSF